MHLSLRILATATSLFFVLGSCAEPESLRLGAGQGGGGGGSGTLPTRRLDLGGLLGVAAGSGTLAVHVQLPPAGFEAALFVSTSRQALYVDPPQAILATSFFELSGLPNATTQFIGLGIRKESTTAGAAESVSPRAGHGSRGARFEPMGVVLSARPLPPIYVDAGASAVGADGKSPATAFGSFQLALDAAALAGGGNLLVRDGHYGSGPFAIPSGVHVYGGFGRGFAFGDRDPAASKTRFGGAGTAAIFVVNQGGASVVLDGLSLDGNRTTAIGIDVGETPVELRSVHVSNFSDRAFRLRNNQITQNIAACVSHCSFVGNGGDGLSVNGAIDLRVAGSSFSFNGQEGMDLDDLIALDGGTTTFEATGCSFFANATEGLDMDLVAPLFGFFGGHFDVTIRGSSFESNGADGLLLDEDYELAAGWTADILVSDTTARANAAAGLHVDADAAGSVLIHRCSSSANSGDGIWISSETHADTVFVAASVIAGNVGVGLRASLGNVAIAATHCLFAGNFGGGFLSSKVLSSATSSVGYLQPAPWTGVRLTSSELVSDPAERDFKVAPDAYHKVVAWSQRSVTLGAGQGAGVVPGSRVEVGDDGVLRSAAQATGVQVVMNSSPERLAIPGLLTVFAPGRGVAEDYRLSPGSKLIGKGMAAKGAPATDPGPWGLPAPAKPGEVDGPAGKLLHVNGTTPALPLGLGGSEALVVEFSDLIDSGSVNATTVRVLTDTGTELSAILSQTGNKVTIAPPVGGWGSARFVVQLHRGLSSSSGVGLATPLSLPVVLR